MRRTVFILFLNLFAQVASASPWKTGSIYDGTRLVEARLDEVVSAVVPGSVLIVSEQHGFKPHHENQVRVLNALVYTPIATESVTAPSPLSVSAVSVGMEFIARKFQSIVDAFLGGLLGEADFLKAVEWGANSFDDYRRQVLFPRNHGGQTLALNASRSLTSRVAKVGLAGLTAAEIAELPKGFQLGNSAYFERFRETMIHHVPEPAIQRYFEAQSVWDETMAETAVEFLRANPEQRLVILVGDFHAAYGGGLPERLRARGLSSVTTISQVDLSGVAAAEEDSVLRPDVRWGARADYVWVSR